MNLVAFPFNLANTYWKVNYLVDLNGAKNYSFIHFLSDHSYEEDYSTSPISYADSKSINKFYRTYIKGNLNKSKLSDGAERFITEPQKIVETQYLTNYDKGRSPTYRLKFEGQSMPTDLATYQHEWRIKGNQLYLFIPPTNVNKRQIILMQQVLPNNFVDFGQVWQLDTLKQKGLTADPQVAKDFRKRILQLFINQIKYDVPDENKSRLNTIFVDSPNGEETIGAITYRSDNKTENIMKFILYRNGKINVYPLKTDFDVPKSYSLNIYKSLQSDNYLKFPDYKN